MATDRIGICPSTGDRCSTMEWVENCLDDELGMSPWQREIVCREVCSQRVCSFGDLYAEE